MSFCVIGVKSKASPKFIERIAKCSDGWDLVTELNQTMAESLEGDLGH
jgi:hypothetical protein